MTSFRSRTRLRRAALLLSCLGAGLGLLACGGSPTPQGEGTATGLNPEVLATFEGGELRIVEVERELPRSSEGPPDVASLPALYRETAGRMALERAWEERLEASGDEVTFNPSALFESPTGRTMVDVYLQEDGESLAPTEEEVKTFFETRRDDLHRMASRRLAYIYRRHRADEDTRALLDDVRRRHLDGAAFDQLAREFSDSETQASGGRLGWVQRGRLSPEVDAVVFGLEAHDVSQPVTMPGGMAIFMVSEVIEARDYNFDELAPRIASHLYEGNRRERLASVAWDFEVPEDAMVLSTVELEDALAGQVRDQEILSVGKARLTIEELWALAPSRSMVMIPAFRGEVQHLETYYRAKVGEALILCVALADDPDAQRITEQVQRRTHRLTRLRELAKEEIRQGLTEEVITEHFERRRHRYQSVIQFQLHRLEIPLGLDPVRANVELSTVRQQLLDGQGDLRTAASQLGGRYQDHGWVDYGVLATWEPKIGTYILELGGTGYTVPFQLNNRLVMVWVESRKEPELLPFDEVRDQVVDDLVVGRWEELFLDWRTAALENIEFQFFGEHLRQHLQPGQDARSSEPSQQDGT